NAYILLWALSQRPQLGDVSGGEPSAALLREFAAVIGEAHVLTGDAAAGYAVDWTGRFRGHAPAVLRPADTAEVAAVLAVCCEAGVPVVPQGGNTGLVGGGVPGHGEGVLSLARLGRVGPVGAQAGQGPGGARTGRPGWTSGCRSPAETAPRSAARARPTRAGCGCCATGRCGPRCAAWRRCSPTAPWCRTWPGWSRTTPGTTTRACWLGPRARSP